MIFSQHIAEGDRKIRNFSLSASFLDDYRDKQPNWGYEGLGYFVYKRTYARDKADGTTEEFWETVQRVVEGVYNIQKIHCRRLRLPWNEPKAQVSAQEMFRRIWEFKFLPPGRGLWMMGTPFVYEKGSACLQNCAFVTTENIDTDFAEPFCFLMDMSMLGVGVGGDTRGAGKVRIRAPKTTDTPYVVEDSREGWVALIRTILDSFAGRGQYPIVIDYSQVRPKGAPILGFGGVSSGPEPLIKLVDSLTTLLTPEDGEESYKIGSSQIVDIFNLIGKCVVAGGVRRTAEILFGEPDDEEFLTLKQDQEALMSHRWASNNSVFGAVGMDYSKIIPHIAKNGEPGIIWLENMRNFGRTGRDPDYGDIRAMGSNPCVEQTLENQELCNLVETFPAHHEDLEDYKRTLKFAYLYAKSVTLVPTHNPRTNVVMMRNRRIGCSMSGITQAITKFGRREFLNWCDEGYDFIGELDTTYSEWLCVPRSIRRTSVKPSGTVSLLAGATPGIHYPHSEYYIRNVRVANTSPLVEACRRAGYPVEPDAYADDTSVISFPIHEKNFSKDKNQTTVWEQFANAADMQSHWADNSVSITITFKKEEEDQIQTCLEHYETRLKSVSMLPLGDEGDHGYVQAPYISTTKEQYAEMMKYITPLDLSTSVHEVDDKFCDGETCTLPAFSPEK